MRQGKSRSVDAPEVSNPAAAEPGAMLADMGAILPERP